MAFELMDVTTGQLLGVYSTQNAALRDVAEAIRDGGVAALQQIALGMDDPSGTGDGTLIAEGDALAELVLRVLGSPAAA